MKNSMKFRHITSIKNKLVDIIDNDQSIKRYCLYLTNSPLSNKAMNKDNAMIEQPDIEESLINKNIIPYMFYEEILDKYKVFIFCHKVKGDLSGVVGTNILAISIVVPVEFNFLKELGEERTTCIADLITDLIDGIKIDNGIREVEVYGYREWKLSRDSTFVGLTLNVQISTSDLRC